MDLFAKTCKYFGLTVSIKKTEVLHRPAPKTPYIESHVNVNGQRLAVADKFV